MSGEVYGRSAWRYPKIVLVLGPPGPIVEAALRRIGLVAICEATDASTWTRPSGEVDAVFPLDGWAGPAELRLSVGVDDEQLSFDPPSCRGSTPDAT